MPTPRDGSTTPAARAPVEQVAGRLSEEDRMLVMLREQIYAGQWSGLLRDLNDRLAGRPFILKLAGRIRKDIERINVLRRIEQRHGVNLADCLDGPGLRGDSARASNPMTQESQ